MYDLGITDLMAQGPRNGHHRDCEWGRLVGEWGGMMYGPVQVIELAR